MSLSHVLQHSAGDVGIRGFGIPPERDNITSAAIGKVMFIRDKSCCYSSRAFASYHREQACNVNLAVAV
jgi:hypothetical protein